MKQTLWLTVDDVCYRLMKDFGCEYMLYYPKDRDILNDHWWHPLDYWHKKGAIEDEKGSEGG